MKTSFETSVILIKERRHTYHISLHTERNNMPKFVCLLLILACVTEDGVVSGKEDIIDITANGEYHWELFMNIDNTKNSGKLTREVTVKSEIFMSYDGMVKSLSSASMGQKIGASLSGKLNEIVSVGASNELSWEVRTEYEKMSKSQKEYRNTTIKTDIYEVGPNSILTLYRLTFKGPGVNYVTDTISSTPVEQPVVPISFKVRQVYVLKDIQVFYTDDSASGPTNMILEGHGKEPNVNDGFGGKFVWLVPVWSKEVDDGATGIQVVCQNLSNSRFQDLGAGVSWDFRYIKMLKDEKSRERIVEIKLWRSGSSYELPTTDGFYQFMTEDINGGRGKPPLRLAWNVTLVP